MERIVINNPSTYSNKKKYIPAVNNNDNIPEVNLQNIKNF